MFRLTLQRFSGFNTATVQIKLFVEGLCHSGVVYHTIQLDL